MFDRVCCVDTSRRARTLGFVAAFTLAAGAVFPAGLAAQEQSARTGYCLPDGTYVDLIVGQPDNDHRWRDAELAPNDGAGPCEAHPRPTRRGAVTPPVSKPRPPRDEAGGGGLGIPAGLPEAESVAVRPAAAVFESRQTLVARWAQVAIAVLATSFLLVAALSSPRLVRGRLPGLVEHRLELAAASVSLLLGLAVAVAL